MTRTVSAASPRRDSAPTSTDPSPRTTSSTSGTGFISAFTPTVPSRNPTSYVISGRERSPQRKGSTTGAVEQVAAERGPSSRSVSPMSRARSPTREPLDQAQQIAQLQNRLKIETGM
eukprot:TRINITY_DN5150_c0_g1_i1.p2 TRINITY_DN5150_c0_g1~~TRINITY_DN5150_c0_g1_i1.p2  ORF type:complete len:117 (+),score=26.94 TRINITY_DN5150_c0_g1_i1:187-537(+)